MLTRPASLIAKLCVLVVRDSRAGAVSSLHTQRSDEAAVRSFSDAILSGPDSMMRKHPDDFELLRIGFLDDESGELEVCEPVVLITAVEVLRRAAPREAFGNLGDSVRDTVAQLEVMNNGR